MKLFEFEARNILRKYGILVVKGNIASKPEKVATIAREIGKPVAVKSQILVSSRGKSGGIVFANDATEAKEIVQHINQAGMGQTTCIGLGGDAIVELDFIKVLGMFKDDEETKGVVLIGEIGGNTEELAAQYIRETNYPKPVVAYIAGRLAPPGKRMGHAGAIIMGSTGTAKSKIDALSAAGIPVAKTPRDVAKLLRISISM